MYELRNEAKKLIFWRTSKISEEQDQGLPPPPHRRPVQRKRFTLKEKLNIVEKIDEKIHGDKWSISKSCTAYGIHRKQYNDWKNMQRK